VMGVESSGSRLAAITAMRMLHLSSNVGRRDINNPVVEKAFWDEVNWSGHGSIGQPYSNWVVVHRSLPQFDCYPTVENLVKLLGPGGFGIPKERIYVIIATRDRHTTLRSKLLEHQPSMEAAKTEQLIAEKLLQGWVKTHEVPTYVFSYESFMSLGVAYLSPLAEFLGTGESSIDPMVLPQGINDANVKWQAPRSIWQQLHQGVDFIFSRRHPAFTTPVGKPESGTVAPAPSSEQPRKTGSITMMKDLLKW